MVIADGLTLPFEQIIDYDGAIVRIREDEVFKCQTPNDFRMLLLNNRCDPNKSLRIYHNFFENNDDIVSNLIRCAELEFEKHDELSSSFKSCKPKVSNNQNQIIT